MLPLILRGILDLAKLGLYVWVLLFGALDVGEDQLGLFDLAF